MDRIANISKMTLRTGFALLFILVPLILTPWNYELFEYNKMMVTYGLTAIILGAWLISMVAKNKFSIKRTPLDIPIILFVLSQLISTIFSMDPHVSWFGYYSRFNGGMLSVLTYVALYYAFVSNTDNIPLLSFRPPSRNPEKMIDSHFRGNDKVFIYRLLKVILITGLVVSLYGIAEHFGIDKNLWVQDVQNRVFSTLGQPNWLAAYLIALIPIAMAFGLKSQNSNNKLQGNSNTHISNKNHSFPIWNLKFLWNLNFVIWSLFSIVFFITVLWTRSRSGLLALGIADILFWGATLARCHLARQGDTFKKFCSSFFIIHAAFFLIIIVNGIYIESIDKWITIKGWQERIATISSQPSAISIQNSNRVASPPAALTASVSAKLIESGVTDSGDIRKYVWQGALSAWQSSPKALLIGTGTESYAFAFYLYRPVGHNLTSEWDFLYNKAHNEYLNFLATTGILGLGCYLFLIGSFIFWFVTFEIFNLKFSLKIENWNLKIKKLHTDAHYDNQIMPITIGLFAGWISILITNFFGFSVVVTQLFFYLFPACIFVLSNISDREISYELDWDVKKRTMISWLLLIITLLLVSLVCVMWYADKQFARGYHLSRAGYMPQAYQALESAITLNPTEPMYHDEQGTILSTLALAAWKEEQATTSQELASMSIKENDAALRISPNNVNFWKSRTKIFYALSSIDPIFLKESIQALEKALTLSPKDPKMYYNLSILYGQADLPEKSLELMKKAIDLKPNYREGYAGLAVLYTQQGLTDLSRQTIQTYLDTVDPNDEEFRKLLQ